RLAFVRAHIDWTVAVWKRVMFTDEGMISCVGSFSRKYSDQEHNCLQLHQVRTSLQGGRGKMLTRGCITLFEPGDLSG
ncbi:hypothetical protein K457DRAFT_38988, partial [Linnemannia elongata AG-77]